jgi:hypothetical protein
MGLSVVTVNKPIAGVNSSNVPADLAEFLAIEVPKALAANGGKDKELILAHDTKALAESYALYARAWGMRDDGAQAQTELHETDEKGKDVLVDGKPVITREAIGYQVEIRRIPPRRDMPDNQIRLSVKRYDPDAPKPGRPAGTTNTPAPTSNGTESGK